MTLAVCATGQASRALLTPAGPADAVGERALRQAGPTGSTVRGVGSIPAFFRTSHAVDAATFTSRLASSLWILRYPIRVLAGQAEDECLDVLASR